jgi:hypothetical protein
MNTVAHNPQNAASLGEFFDDAARGTLPSFSWINPRSGINMTTGHGSNDMHPTHVFFFFHSSSINIFITYFFILVV